MIRVQAPNGSVVEFPDGTPADVMANAMRQAFGGPSEQAPDPIRQRAEEMANQVESIQGPMGAGSLFRNSFALGLNDKITGLTEGVASMLRGGSFGDGYKAGSLAEQMLEERARERSGAMGTAAEIGGSLATGALAKAPAAATAFGRMLQAGKEAGTLGLIQGAGDSTKTDASIVGDAIIGGGLGAGLGAGLTGALEAARPMIRGGRAAYNSIRNMADDTGQRAANRVVNNLQADELTPGKAMARMNTRGQSLLDVAGDNTMGLGRSASAKPGRGRTIMNRALDAGQASRADRALDAVQDGLGGADEAFNIRLNRMATERGAKAKDVYERAFTQNYGSKHSMKFDELAGRIPPEAVRNAHRIAKAEGRPFGEQLVAAIDDNAGTVQFRRTPSLREWHYIQRGLRSATDKAYREGVGEVGTAFKNLHRDVLGAMDEANPLYKMARRSYAEKSQLMEAVQRGREIMQPGTLRNLDQLADDFGRMSKPEKEMMRLGLSRAMQDAIESTPSTAGDVVNKLMGTPQKRKAIRMLFDSDSAFRSFEIKMRRMSKEAANFKNIRTGSRTSFVDAEKQTSGNLTEMAEGLIDIGRGGYASAAMRGLSKLVGNLGQMDAATAEQVARILTSQDPQFVRNALSTSLSRQARQQVNNELMRRIGSIVRGATVGGSAAAGSSVVQAQ